MSFLEENFKQIKNNEYEEKIVANGGNKTTNCSRTNTVWRKYGCYTMIMLHKSHLCSGQLLDDLHIGAAQALFQRQFSNIGGIQNFVIQDTDSLQRFTEKDSL